MNVPFVFYHVLSRGNDGRTIFSAQPDYQAYLAHLKGLLEPMQMRLHAYCLMPNHVHLLIEALSANLSRLIERQHGWYARRYNWRHQRFGHVFQGRFMAKRVSDDAYLLEVGRYIHMNPVKASLTPRPENYSWSSFASYLAARQDGLTCRDKLLSFHDGDRTRFYEFTTARFDLAADSRGWPIGNWYTEDGIDGEMLPQRLQVTPGLLSDVGKAFGCAQEELRHRRRSRPELAAARAAAALALRCRSDLSLKDICAELGFRNVNSVCNRIRWIVDRAKSDAMIASRLERIGLGEHLGEFR